MHEIRQATASDARQLGDILGDAFAEDPAFNWVIPHPPLYPAFFRQIAAQSYLAHGHCHLEQAGRGGALWLPPGVSSEMRFSLGQLGLMARLAWHRGPRILRRAMQAQETMARHHPTAPHFYLHAIGAIRDCQGQGIGSALLKVGTRECDRTGMPAYLESSSPRNTELYLRHGFEITAEAPVGEGGPTLQFMWREPQALPDQVEG